MTPPVADPRPLTAKQARFVEEYLMDLNATQAATRAGYSARTANEQGARLLANASVAAAVTAGKAARSERTDITQDWVLDQIKANIAAAYEAAQHAPVNKGLELLGKHIGMFTDVLRHEGALEILTVRRQTR